MRILIGIFISLSLISCSLIEEYKVKNAALDFIRKQYEESYRAEMRSSIGEFHHRGNDYVGYVLRHTTFSVEKINLIEPDYYQVELNIRAYSPEIRNALLDKLKPLTEEQAANSFNFGDGMDSLQKKYPNIISETDHKTVVGVKKINDKWLAK